MESFVASLLWSDIRSSKPIVVQAERTAQSSLKAVVQIPSSLLPMCGADGFGREFTSGIANRTLGTLRVASCG